MKDGLCPLIRVRVFLEMKVFYSLNMEISTWRNESMRLMTDEAAKLLHQIVHENQKQCLLNMEI